MCTVSILRRAIARARIDAPRRILELGAGDGSLLLRLALALRPRWRAVDVTLLDRHNIVSAATRAGFAAIDWNVEVLCADALDWAEGPGRAHYDLCLTTLFLHHFQTSALRALLGAAAASTDVFIACEPRRNAAGRLGSRLIGLLGVNAVTRADAMTSVAAGFAARELEALWTRDDSAWQLHEFAAWPFTHCFVARRSTELPSSLP
jgi:SAM-dependent methyltransferase